MLDELVGFGLDLHAGELLDCLALVVVVAVSGLVLSFIGQEYPLAVGLDGVEGATALFAKGLHLRLHSVARLDVDGGLTGDEGLFGAGG